MTGAWAADRGAGGARGVGQGACGRGRQNEHGALRAGLPHAEHALEAQTRLR
jgi:hypothetical protein